MTDDVILREIRTLSQVIGDALDRLEDRVDLLDARTQSIERGMATRDQALVNQGEAIKEMNTILRGQEGRNGLIGDVGTLKAEWRVAKAGMVVVVLPVLVATLIALVKPALLGAILVGAILHFVR